MSSPGHVSPRSPRPDRRGSTVSGSDVERAAMRRALTLAASPGVPLGPNPRVGCVLLDAAGHTIAEGFHRGAGSPHAEVDALSRAGAAARGATAVVTLEPCNHTGRTGPCAQALIAAGVRRVVIAQRDTNPVAVGRRRHPARRRGRGGDRAARRRGTTAEPGLDLRRGASAARSSPGSSPPRSTAGARPPTAPAAGSRARPLGSTPIGCGRSATPCWSAPTRSPSTTHT